MKESKTYLSETDPKMDLGMTVPEGYFEDFAKKMAGQLPFRSELDIPESKRPAATSQNKRWLKIRPYVYMAAMFAGAWCLLKMFTLMTATPDELSLDNYPNLSKAVSNEEFVNDYIYTISPNDVFMTLEENGELVIPDDLDTITIAPMLPAEPADMSKINKDQQTL